MPVPRTTPEDVRPIYPSNDALAVTPHDTDELADLNRVRGIYVGGAGDLTVIFGDATILFAAVPAGTLLPISPRVVKATGTAATNIVALY